MKYLLILCSVLFLCPSSSMAQVRITEIAWMGTTTSQFSEWIELYNDESTGIDLKGWKLYEEVDTLVYTLTQSIPAHGYLLIERITASAPDAISGIDDESGGFGGGGLANTGEILVLKDVTGSIVEKLDFADGWPAGDATTKETMQWDSSAWITATPTPKAPTSTIAPIPKNEVSTPSAKNKKRATDPNPIPAVSPNKPHVEFVLPPVIYQGVPYAFMAQPIFEYNYRVAKGIFDWNMGDGSVSRYQSNVAHMHTYQYPGTYTISFQYTDPTKNNVKLLSTKKVQVTTPEVAIRILKMTALEIKNTSTTPVDLSKWTIVSSSQRIMIPDMTILAEKSTAVIPFGLLGILSTSDITLVNPSGVSVATTATAQKGTHQVNTTSTSPKQDTTPAVRTPQVLGATASFIDTSVTGSQTPTHNRTKRIVFGAVVLFVIVLSILLERFMARQEYQE